MRNFEGEIATSFAHEKSDKLTTLDFAMLAHPMGVERAADLEGTLETAIKSNQPYLVEVVVDREIRPVGTGTWSPPPLPHPEPNFTRLARGK